MPWELRVESPLIRIRIFGDRGFAVDNIVLFLLFAVFIPFFFFASMYAQIGLGQSASEAGLFLLIFFAGFATASQWGGRLLDQQRRASDDGAGLPPRRDRLCALGRRLPDLSSATSGTTSCLQGRGSG